MLGHDPGATPAVEERRMEAGVGLLELEMDGLTIGSADRFDIIIEEAVGIEAVKLDQGLAGLKSKQT
jgi:hypothetical protein